MNKNIIFAIAKKELLSFINSPLAYVIVVPFLLISLFIHLRTSLVAGDATLRGYFDLLPWFLVIVAPALSMKLITDEKKEETLELLLGHPVSETEIVVGKLLGVSAFFALLLAGTLGLPLSLLMVSRPDLGVFIAQYLGALLTGITFLSIGLFASSMVANAIGSLLLGAGMSFILVLIGLPFVTMLIPWPFSIIVMQLSILTHVEGIARGVLDLRDVFYFVTIITGFILATVTRLQVERFEQKQKQVRAVSLLGVVLMSGFLVNILFYFVPLRVDLTTERLFTLSSGTRKTLTALPDEVSLTLYVSQTLPGSMQTVSRQISDTLSDYGRLSSKLKIKTVNPESDVNAMKEAQERGMTPVTFNSIGTGKFEAQQGFLGITIVSKEKTEIVPFIQDTSDLEYQLTRKIRKVLADAQPQLGFYNNSGKNFQLLRQALAESYEIADIDLEKDHIASISALLVFDDGTIETTAAGALKKYIEANGKALLLVEGVTLNSQLLTATTSASQISSFLPEWGVQLNNDVVFDLERNETLTFGAGGQHYLLPYPFWMQVVPAETTVPFVSGIKSVTLGWASSFTLTPQNGIVHTPLFITSSAAGHQENNFALNPELLDSLPKPLGKELITGVLVEKDKGRLVVIGDTDFAVDQFLQNNQDNFAFLSNTLDYLATDDVESIVPAKASGRSVFYFSSPVQLLIFQYGNLLIPPILVGVTGFIILSRRKRLARRVYK